MFDNALQKSAELLLRGGTGIQLPLAEKFVGKLQHRYPDVPPEKIEQWLESGYLVVVTASGTAAGLSAAAPGVGTVIGLVAGGIDALFFLEASALYASSVGAVHGMESLSPGARRALVVGVVLGDSATEMLGGHASRSARDWAAVVADKLPVVRSIDNAMAKKFVIRFILQRGMLTFGKALPMGIGAVIGAAGNLTYGRVVVDNAHRSFGRGMAGAAE